MKFLRPRWVFLFYLSIYIVFVAEAISYQCASVPAVALATGVEAKRNGEFMLPSAIRLGAFQSKSLE